MMEQLWVYVFILMLAGLLSGFLSVFAFIKVKDAPGAKYYILVTLFSAIFTFAYAMELVSPTLREMKLWLSVEYLVMPFIPLFILFMCIDYVGKKVKPTLQILLMIIPVTTIFIHGTNDIHSFYYKSVDIRQDTPFPVLQLEGGPWFYVHSIFLFLCLMISIVFY